MTIINILFRFPFKIMSVFVIAIGIAMIEGLNLALIASLLQNNVSIPIQLPQPFSSMIYQVSQLPLTVKLQHIAGCLLVLTVIKAVLYGFNIRLSLVLRNEVMSHYRLLCLRRIMYTSMGYLNKSHSSKVQMIFDSYIDLSIGFIVDFILSSLPGLFTLALLLIFLFNLSMPIACVSLILGIGASLMMGSITKHIKHLGDEFVIHKEAFNRVVLDVIQGMKLIRLFAREEAMTEVFNQRMRAYNNATIRSSQWTGMVPSIFELVGVIILAIILWVAGQWLVNSHSFDVGVLLVFILVWVRLMAPLKGLNQARAAIVARLPALQAVERFIQEASDAHLPNGNKNFSGLAKSINFQDVSFKYNDAWVLQNFSLVVKKGVTIGIVGLSGSGKSTLADLLMRFYDSQKGSLFIDEENIKVFDINSFRRHVGFVAQDTFLFHDTIRANIVFASPTVSDQVLYAAAKRAYAHDFIMALPQGYETKIGDRGVMLSGGQRQRLAIARAILHDPQILIFDEATSALDMESEAIVQRAIDEIAVHKTVIIIAHRLSTVMNADQVVVLDNGKIVEQGSPKELLNSSGAFSRLMSLQQNGI